MMRERLRRDDGMTLVELLVGMGAATVVVFAAYAAISAALNMQTRTIGRVDAAQRGRVAMETITRDIRAQMCLPTTAGLTSSSLPAMIWASGDGIQFYSSVAEASKTSTPGDTQPPEMRRLEWIPENSTNAVTGASNPTLNRTDSTAQPVGKIVESVYRPDQAKPPYTFLNYPNKPYRRMTIATDVEKIRRPDGTIVPIFQYYGYTVDGGIGRPSKTPFPFTAAAADKYNTDGDPSVASTNLAAVVLVEIQFAARPYGQHVTDANKVSTPTRPTSVVPFYNRVSVRTADPTDPGVSPLCL